MALDSEHLERLIEESASGNAESYRELYDHLVGKIFAYVRSRVNERAQATDLTQDVFVELWKALPRFVYHSREQFFAFVFVITKRQLAAHYASQKRATVSFEEDSMEDISATAPGEETADAILRGLETLDSDTREIVVLHHWSRYTFGEIGKLMHMRETAVRVRHHRAMRALEKYITGA